MQTKAFASFCGPFSFQVAPSPSVEFGDVVVQVPARLALIGSEIGKDVQVFATTVFQDGAWELLAIRVLDDVHSRVALLSADPQSTAAAQTTASVDHPSTSSSASSAVTPQSAVSKLENSVPDSSERASQSNVQSSTQKGAQNGAQNNARFGTQAPKQPVSLNNTQRLAPQAAKPVAAQPSSPAGVKAPVSSTSSSSPAALPSRFYVAPRPTQGASSPGAARAPASAQPIKPQAVSAPVKALSATSAPAIPRFSVPDRPKSTGIGTGARISTFNAAPASAALEESESTEATGRASVVPQGVDHWNQPDQYADDIPY